MISQPEQPDSGGFGGAVEYPTNHPSEMGKLEARALMEGWGEPDDREEITKEMGRLAMDKSAKPRDRIRAYQALTANTHRKAQIVAQQPQSVTINQFGVMRVPVSTTDEEWEAGCEADQKRLTGGNGHQPPPSSG